MLIPSFHAMTIHRVPSLSRRVNANSQQSKEWPTLFDKLIKKGEC